jgi:mycothiol synthase
VRVALGEALARQAGQNPQRLLALVREWFEAGVKEIQSARLHHCGLIALRGLIPDYGDEVVAFLAALPAESDLEARAAFLETLVSVAKSGRVGEVYELLGSWAAEDEPDTWIIAKTLSASWAAHDLDQSEAILQALERRVGENRIIERAKRALARHGKSNPPRKRSDPAPPRVEGYIWRPAKRVDSAAVHRMLQAVDVVDDTDSAGLVEDIERNFDDPWSDDEKDSLLAMKPDGTVVALGWVYMNPEPEEIYKAYLWLEVHPDYRKLGLGAAMLSWLEDRGKQRLLEKPADHRRELRIGCPELLQERIVLFERFDYQPIRYFFRMRRDLSRPIPDKSLPEGLSLRTYHPDLDRLLMEAFNDSFQDHWNFTPVTEVDWQLFFTGRSVFRPDISYLAMAPDLESGDEQIAGFCLNSVSPEENKRQSIEEGWINQLGVRRPWRKHGVATALLCLSMQAFKSEGLDYATLGVDAENLTGALQLYERLGFEAVKRYISFFKSVSTPGD